MSQDNLEEINFKANLPRQYYEEQCPHCKYNIRFVMDVRYPNYYKFRTEFLERRLDANTEFLKRIDEWCVQNIGDTYAMSQWRAFLDKIRRNQNDTEVS